MIKINFFKKEKNFKKKNFAFNANLYWEFALLVLLIMILLSSFFGYYLFSQINQEPVLSIDSTNVKASILDKNKLEKILNYFSDRQKKSIEILNSPLPVVDPSL